MKQTFVIKNRYTSEVLFSYELVEGQELAMIARQAVEAAIKSGANLRNADLRCADLRGADLRDANLRGADFWCANLRGADFWCANLRGANLEGTYLNGANLEGAILEGADLEGADLEGAYLEGAYLEGADLEGAYLEGVIGDMTYIKSMQIDTWFIAYTSANLQIGCKLHPIDDWKDWKNKPEWIAEMASNASEWANKYLDLVLQIIELSPATPTR